MKKWTFESCKEDAILYQTLGEWSKRSPGAYNAAYKNGWKEECSIHMPKRKPISYWNKDLCQKEANKCTTRKEFRKKSNGAYVSALNNGWLDEICHFMKILKQKNMFESCKKEALKYNTKKDFSESAPNHYEKAYKYGFLNEICSHMKVIGNYKKRMIYVYEFPDKYFYTGLTYNEEKRNYSHLMEEKSSVFKHIQETGLQPVFVAISDYIEAEEAQKLEGETKLKYEQNGWISLNKAKTGGLGGGYIKWTFENCLRECLKYNTLSELRKNNFTVYNVCWKNKWTDKCFAHFKSKNKPKGYWTFEKCLEQALKYEAQSEFRKFSYAAYIAACKNKWIKECCSHMIVTRKPDGYWTLQRCQEDALLYQTREEWKENSTGYKTAANNKWMDLCCAHMKKYTKRF